MSFHSLNRLREPVFIVLFVIGGVSFPALAQSQSSAISINLSMTIPSSVKVSGQRIPRITPRKKTEPLHETFLLSLDTLLTKKQALYIQTQVIGETQSHPSFPSRGYISLKRLALDSYAFGFLPRTISEGVAMTVLIDAADNQSIPSLLLVETACRRSNETCVLRVSFAVF